MYYHHNQIYFSYCLATRPVCWSCGQLPQKYAANMVIAFLMLATNRNMLALWCQWIYVEPIQRKH